LSVWDIAYGLTSANGIHPGREFVPKKSVALDGRSAPRCQPMAFFRTAFGDLADLQRALEASQTCHAKILEVIANEHPRQVKSSFKLGGEQDCTRDLLPTAIFASK
jgi:hypothetical protein